MSKNRRRVASLSALFVVLAKYNKEKSSKKKPKKDGKSNSNVSEGDVTISFVYTDWGGVVIRP